MNTSETPWPGISIPTAVPERSVRVLAAAKAVVASQPRLFKEPGVEGGALLTWEDLGRSGKDMEGPVSTRGGLGVMWGKLCGTSLFGGLDQVIPSHTKSLPANGGSMGFQFSFENDYSNEGVSDAARCVSQSIHKHILFADDCQNGGK